MKKVFFIFSLLIVHYSLLISHCSLPTSFLFEKLYILSRKKWGILASFYCTFGQYKDMVKLPLC